MFAEARRLVSQQRVDGWVRVSRIGGRVGDGYISPEVQREQISALAGLMGVEIDAWHDDDRCARAAPDGGTMVRRIIDAGRRASIAAHGLVTCQRRSRTGSC